MSRPADERLIREALQKAGGQIHGIVGTVAMYRSALADSPRTAEKLERALRRFVACGRLQSA